MDLVELCKFSKHPIRRILNLWGQFSIFLFLFSSSLNLVLSDDFMEDLVPVLVFGDTQVPRWSRVQKAGWVGWCCPLQKSAIRLQGGNGMIHFLKLLPCPNYFSCPVLILRAVIWFEKSGIWERGRVISSRSSNTVPCGELEIWAHILPGMKFLLLPSLPLKPARVCAVA